MYTCSVQLENHFIFPKDWMSILSHQKFEVFLQKSSSLLPIASMDQTSCRPRKDLPPRWRNRLERSARKRKLGVRIPVTIDTSRKNR